MLYRNLNFGQAVSLKLLRITILYTGPPFQSFLTLIYHIIHHGVLALAQPISQQIADAVGADVVLFGCNWRVYQTTL